MNTKTRSTLLLALALSLGSLAAAPNEIGFVENFVLSDDRQAALADLVPGTEEYYYFHALHYQHTAQDKKLKTLLANWTERHRNSNLRTTIQHRQALLDYEKDPVGTISYLKDQLRLTFNHSKEIPEKERQLPTNLDPDRISADAFYAIATANTNDLNRLSDAGLAWALATGKELTTTQRRSLLSRIQRPDHPNLLDHVIADLKSKNAPKFGGHKIHHQLLLDQLDALRKAVPSLANNETFVLTYLRKLRPGADQSLTRDPAARAAYIDRARAFANTLSPAFNSLKAHLLYHQLLLQSANDTYERAAFLQYIKLPRHVPYINETWRKEEGALWNHACDLNHDFSSATGLPPVRNESSLVRSFLLHFLANENSTTPFARYLSDKFLDPLFAEAKITSGKGDPESHASALSPTAFAALRDRVDLQFAPSNAKVFAPGDDVSLDLFVKNVPDLIVKIYEINAFNVYQQTGEEIGTDLNLDGLVPNKRTAHQHTESPYQRVRRTFTFPGLKNRRGVWVVEFVGNGISSRALVRKGTLTSLEERTAAGHALTVIDETRTVRTDVSAHFGGREYAPDEDGTIFIPYSTNPGNRTVVLADPSGFASLSTLNHRAEDYRLTAGFHVERESLLAGKTATLAVSPSLTVAGASAPLTLLEDVTLTILSTDIDGNESTAEFKITELSDTDALLQDFTVPARTVSLDFAIEGKAPLLTTGQKADLHAHDSIVLNTNLGNASIAQHHLVRTTAGYACLLLGKTGEPLANRSVRITFAHPNFSNPITLELKTDATGTITLGSLEEIAAIGFGDKLQPLPHPIHTLPRAVHAVAGTPVNVPLPASDSPAYVSLLELTAGTFTASHTAQAEPKDGYLVLSGLKPGDYSLAIGAHRPIPVRITAGKPVANRLVSDHRVLEAGDPAPVVIRSVDNADGKVTINLAGHSDTTRVHITTSRFVPPHDLALFPDLAPRVTGLSRFTPGYLPSVYLSGRDIGDEYRYILERRTLQKFPTLLVDRPGLLLNPWELRDTETIVQHAADAEELERLVEDEAAKMEQPKAGAAADDAFGGEVAPGDPRTLDFLLDQGVVAYNLPVAPDGTVTVSLENLGDRQHLHVLAVDAGHAAYADAILPDRPAARHRDLRLADGLDPQKHYARQNTIQLVQSGDDLVIDDLRTAELQSYTTLADVFSLYTTLTDDPAFNEFEFITRWPDLAENEKLALYSKYASHELHVFLAQKDPGFFDTVVAPYLDNKKDLTFIDEFLLGIDLNHYLEPWRFAQLNTAERALLAQQLEARREAITTNLGDLLAINHSTSQDNFARNLYFGKALRGRGLALASETLSFGINADATVDFFADPQANTFDIAAGLAAKKAPASPPAPSSRMAGRRLSEQAKNITPRLANKERQQALALDDAGIEKFRNTRRKMLEKATRSRGSTARLYIPEQQTKELAENNYHHLPIVDQNAELVGPDRFWLDYASWDRTAPFISEHFPAAAQNRTAALLALAVLDLPFKAKIPDAQPEENHLKVTPGTPVIAFYRALREAPVADDTLPLLVSQTYFRSDDPTEIRDGVQMEKTIDGEFLSGVVYTSKVVVSNPSATPRQLSVMTQVPTGSLPVAGSSYTDTRPVGLDPYSTAALDYHFYFPAAGEFATYPAHVTEGESVVAHTDTTTFNVVESLSEIDRSSWPYLSQNGSKAEVLTYLNTKNLQSVDLSKIAWRLKSDPDFFDQVIAALDSRLVYDHTLYSYAALHGRDVPLSHYLENRPDLIAACGPYLESPLLTIDPVERKSYQHLEYAPLVNARSHKLSARRTIPNAALFTQYHALLDTLACKPDLDDTDRLSLAGYLLLQDRVADALTQFVRVHPDNIDTSIQHAYLATVLSLYREDLATARAIATAFADHPVERWRNRFTTVIAQLDELQGVKGPDIDPEDRTGTQDALADAQPYIGFTIDPNGTAHLDYRNTAVATVNYYEMDLEFLFSSSPFLDGDNARFSVIKPNKTEVLQLDPTENLESFLLPQQYQTRNVLVEVLSSGQRRAVPHFATQMDVTLAANYGRLQVTHKNDGRPLSKVYVKVYAQNANGSPTFYKDGYTDFRGKFDYTSLTRQGEELAGIKKFALLVISENHGATVLQSAPPTR